MKVKANLLRQNCYLRDVCPPLDLQTKVEETQYPTLVEEVTQEGLKHHIEYVPYQITPEYVNSFAASADYHNDIITAINAPSRGSNLGDIRDAQHLLNMDSAAARALYDQLLAKAALLEQAHINGSDFAPASAPGRPSTRPTTSNSRNDNKEVASRE